MSDLYEIKDTLEKVYRKIQTDYAPLERRVKDLETRTRERKWLGLPGVDADKFSLFRAVKAIQTGAWEDAGYEREVFDNMNRRALGASDDAAGGYLVPTEAIPGLIEQLRAESVCMKMGATVLDNLSGAPVIFPKATGGASTFWLSDNDAITPSQPSFGQLRLTPYKAAALVQLSNMLIYQSNPSAEAAIRQDIAQGLALAVDLAALRGAGSENEPQGIANTPGINVVPMSGAGLGNSLDLFADMEHELAVDNALRGRLGYVFHPAVRRALKGAKIPQWDGDTGGFPLIPQMIWASMRGDGALQEALGYLFATTTQIPANLGTGENETEIYFGNWADLLIAQWAGLEILVSNVAGTAFAYDQTWLRVILNVDVGLRHAESFCLCNDVSTS